MRFPYYTLLVGHETGRTGPSLAGGILPPHIQQVNEAIDMSVF